MFILYFMMILFALLVMAFMIQYRAYNNICQISESCHIGVIYENNTYGKIKRNRLEEFIASGSIIKFFRSSGWATIDVDPMRESNNGHLIERRVLEHSSTEIS